MAKLPTASAAPIDVLKKTFELARPIEVNGELVGSLTLEEPTLAHFINSDKGKKRFETVASLISTLTLIPEPSIRKMNLRDMRAISAWFDELRAAKGGSQDTDDAGFVTFNLVTPLQTNAAPVTKLRLREPDLDMAIEVEKFKTENEMTAAMIASLAGVTLPLVHRLRLRDVALIEDWLDPFVQDGN